MFPFLSCLLDVIYLIASSHLVGWDIRGFNLCSPDGYWWSAFFMVPWVVSGNTLVGCQCTWIATSSWRCSSVCRWGLEAVVLCALWIPVSCHVLTVVCHMLPIHGLFLPFVVCCPHWTNLYNLVCLLMLFCSVSCPRINFAISMSNPHPHPVFSDAVRQTHRGWNPHEETMRSLLNWVCWLAHACNPWTWK